MNASATLLPMGIVPTSTLSPTLTDPTKVPAELVFVETRLNDSPAFVSVPLKAMPSMVYV